MIEENNKTLDSYADSIIELSNDYKNGVIDPKGYIVSLGYICQMLNGLIYDKYSLIREYILDKSLN